MSTAQTFCSQWLHHTGLKTSSSCQLNNQHDCRALCPTRRWRAVPAASLTRLVNDVRLAPRQQAQQVVGDAKRLPQNAAGVGEEGVGQPLRLGELVIVLGAVCVRRSKDMGISCLNS